MTPAPPQPPMPPLVDFAAGNYRFLPPPVPASLELGRRPPPWLARRGRGSPFSSGVVALPGYKIVRVTLDPALPYREGFGRIEQHLAGHGRPRTALCAVELRSPAPYTAEQFKAFNAEYGALLTEWGLLQGNGPTARTNVAPVLQPPAEPVLHAFSYTARTNGDPDGAPAPDAVAATFVVSGAPEPPWLVQANAPLVERARSVVSLMARRLTALGAGWQDVSATVLYTADEVPVTLVAELLAAAGAGGAVRRPVAVRPPAVDRFAARDRCPRHAEELRLRS